MVTLNTYIHAQNYMITLNRCLVFTKTIMINNDEINHTKTIIMSKNNSNVCLKIAA